MGRSPSKQITILQSLAVIGIVVVKICLFWLKGKIPYALALIRHYCLSLEHMACNANTRQISGRGHNNIPVCPMKDSRSWSDMSTRAIDGTYLKNFCQTVKKQCQEYIKKSNCKEFCVTRKRNDLQKYHSPVEF